MPMPVPVNLFADVGILYAFQHSNPAGKAVIFCLVLGSIFSWSVMVSKFLMVHRARRATGKSIRAARAMPSIWPGARN
jgi:biopolymer transport protein TolQ